jgi:hypothetical protein
VKPDATSKRLTELIAEWRHTADIWDEQERQSYWPTAKGVQQPPERGRSAIRNWVNWLRACAHDVEVAMRFDEAHVGGTTTGCITKAKKKEQDSRMTPPLSDADRLALR